MLRYTGFPDCTVEVVKVDDSVCCKQHFIEGVVLKSRRGYKGTGAVLLPLYKLLINLIGFETVADLLPS